MKGYAIDETESSSDTGIACLIHDQMVTSKFSKCELMLCGFQFHLHILLKTNYIKDSFIFYLFSRCYIIIRFRECPWKVQYDCNF